MGQNTVFWQDKKGSGYSAQYISAFAAFSISASHRFEVDLRLTTLNGLKTKGY